MSTFIKFAKLFVTILLCLTLLSSSRLVKASDQSRIQKLCSQTREAEACKSCLHSDHSRGSDGIPDLIYSVIFCMYTEATHGHENADMLAQKSTLKLKQALSSCSAKLFDAENLLGDGLTLMEGKKYHNAYNNVEQSRVDLLSCEDVLRNIANAPVLDVLQQHLIPLNRLSDVAFDFFRHLNISG